MRIFLYICFLTLPAFFAGAQSDDREALVFNQFKRYAACKLTQLSVQHGSASNVTKASVNKVCGDCNKPPTFERLIATLKSKKAIDNARLVQQIRDLELPPQYRPLDEASLLRFFREGFFRSGQLKEFAGDRLSPDGKYSSQKELFKQTQADIEAYISRLFQEAALSQAPEEEASADEPPQEAQYREPTAAEEEAPVKVQSPVISQAGDDRPHYLLWALTLLNTLLLGWLLLQRNKKRKQRYVAYGSSSTTSNMSMAASELKHLKEEVEKLRNELIELRNANNKSKTAAPEEKAPKATTPPPSFEPQTYYFEVPNPQGYFLAEKASSQYKEGRSIFVLNRYNEQEADFRLVESPAAYELAMQFRKEVLHPVSVIAEGNDWLHGKRLEVIRPGRARLEQGKWVVTEKMVIQYV
ncbi:MAG: hypothetical protein KatS3mg033_0664 [Thermonema sp.]|uniref:hypothetical protein n=1 Tax=Thermonema sp. TaxID=2231181 RepID=UPI0021DC9470|nr:hypothetical protein [Thermonema sp.]GIV38864.1 MAG: hypothetical protein KatS3mg033_0664 [Thermonema sp.]